MVTLILLHLIFTSTHSMGKENLFLWKQLIIPLVYKAGWYQSKIRTTMMAKLLCLKAIVGQQNDSDAVQFELQGNGDDIEIATYVNGEKIDFSELKSQEFDNVTVTDTGNNTLNAIFSTGAYITVAEANGMISTLIVSLPDMYRGKTRGLYGNI